MVNLKVIEGDESTIRFSGKDMITMAAKPGDLVYLCDKRKWLGGLKSIHSSYGETHSEDGIVYISEEQLKTGMFVEGRLLIAEKEM